jgi:hypothetical protein
MFGIQARDGRSAVIFRQGPNRHFLLVRWWLKDDRFEEGHWVKCKIYVRRCDLSEDGEMLIYFAARHTGPLYSWTAISRPPFFTALALWPKTDSWGGGGLFEGNRIIHLNHNSADLNLAAGHVLPRNFFSKRLGETPGFGEDGYIQSIKMERDGWRLVQDGNVDFEFNRKPFLVVDPHFIHEKPNPKNNALVLRITFFGIGESTNSKHIMENYEIVTRHGTILRSFELFDWADWAQNGDLLLADAGRVLRLPYAEVGTETSEPFDGCRELLNLTNRTFEAKESPGWAKKWPK